MKRYEAYKDSGVDWIGEIPEYWEVPKINYLFKKIGSGTTPTAGSLLYYENGTINFLQTGDLNDGLIKSTTKKITKKALLDNSSMKIFPKGSLVIAMYGATIGKLGILNLETTTNQACCVLGEEIYNVNMKYIFYWFYFAKPHIISLSYGGGQPNISQDLIKSLRLQVPPLSEQTAIAQFLDDKTAKIDQTIGIRQKEIELLKERRQILIQQAVTKGLDATAPMKNSGVDWIGEIPEHWEVRKLKYVLTMRNEKIETKTTKKIYVGMENIESKTGKYLPTHFQVEGLANVFYKADILFGKLRPYLAKVYLSEFDGICSTEFLVYKSSNTSYYQRVLLSDVFIKLVDSSTYGAKMPRASADFINNIPIPVSPTQEQTQIVSYLEKIEEKIAKAISIKEQEIEKLKEYKTVLIDNVVTGKVKINLKINNKYLDNYK